MQRKQTQDKSLFSSNTPFCAAGANDKKKIQLTSTDQDVLKIHLNCALVPRIKIITDFTNQSLLSHFFGKKALK